MKYVFLLEHVRIDEDDGCEYLKTIGVYSSQANAEAVINQLKEKPGFVNYPDGFNIDKYEIDKIFWNDGFG